MWNFCEKLGNFDDQILSGIWNMVYVTGWFSWCGIFVENEEILATRLEVEFRTWFQLQYWFS